MGKIHAKPYIDFVANIQMHSRGIVLHSGEDDLGLGNSPLSNTTGNSGERSACGVIGCKLVVTTQENSLLICLLDASITA